MDNFQKSSLKSHTQVFDRGISENVHALCNEM